jgi:hypothetical protein
MTLPSVQEFLDGLGLAGANLVAGFSGGVLNVLFFKTVNPWDATAAIAAGTLTAGYLGVPIADITHFPVGATCFIVGFGGFAILGGAFSVLRQRFLQEKPNA